jgi:hypothetical protein
VRPINTQTKVEQVYYMIQQEHGSPPLPQSVVGFLLLISCRALWSGRCREWQQYNFMTQQHCQVFKGVNIFQARTNLLIKWVWILRLFYCIDGWRGCKIGKLCFLPVTIRPMPQLLGKTARSFVYHVRGWCRWSCEFRKCWAIFSLNGVKI